MELVFVTLLGMSVILTGLALLTLKPKRVRVKIRKNNNPKN